LRWSRCSRGWGSPGTRSPPSPSWTRPVDWDR
jgi:hypothetical protein